MNDFLEEIKVAVLPIKQLQIKHHVSCDTFRLFSTGCIQYLPSRLTDKHDNIIHLMKSDPDTMPTDQYQQECMNIREHYVTIGRMMNYLLKEDFPIPMPFASPFIILYLINSNQSKQVQNILKTGNRINQSTPSKDMNHGDNSDESDSSDCELSDQDDSSISNEGTNLKDIADASSFAFYYLNQRTLSDLELKQAILNFDMEYKGSIELFYQPSSDGSRTARENLYYEFIYPVIIKPRQEALIAIREGFNIVPFVSHLQYFTYREFIDVFVGEDVYDYNDIKSRITYDFNDVNFTLYEQEQFIENVNSALARLDHEMIRLLLIFVTGAALFKRGPNHGTFIKIVPKIYSYNPSKDSNHCRYPQWPLVRTRTCFSHMRVPFFKSSSSFETNCDGDSDTDCRLKEGPVEICELWTKENVYENLIASLNHSRGDFYDGNM